MLKQIYRGIILIIVFVAALYYFSGDIKEVVFSMDNTTTMEDATFPLVTIKTGNNTINQLHGYSSNLDANKIRESVTPLDLNQTFEVVIDQKEYEIKKLNYEIREFTLNSLIETDSISVFEDDGDVKTAKIKLKAELSAEKEYAVKLTLITSKSEKIYYYQRIKIYENAHLPDKLDFIMEFHNAIMDKTTAVQIIRYLEPSNDVDNTSLASVNINSSFDLVSWGNLKPTILTEIVPFVKEIYQDTASVELSYIAQAEIAGVVETYRVTEFYRVRYSTDRMYLLNYERHMESIFDASLASVAKNELKLGITTDFETPYEAGDDATKIAFVRDGALWFYDLAKNEITQVFSFRQKDTDYIRDLYNQHDIRILNMDAEGNMDFLVYGYMNRGQYEGRVAIILYRFIRAESRTLELVYIPVDEAYPTLKDNLGELSYVNSKEVFYFQIYNTIYSYNMITKKLSEIATDISKDQVVVLKNMNSVVWQENADPKRSNHIYIMNMETGGKETITAKQGYNIRLMGKIDSNIIYGYVDKKDVTSMIDGSILAPLSMVEIASVDKTVLKSYTKQGYYVSGIVVKDNIVELRRVQKVNENGTVYYTLAEPDHIINQKKTENSLLGVTARVTEQALNEYYMTFPNSLIMGEQPKVLSTVSTVISEDPTIRLTKARQTQLYYYPYIMGGIAGAFENAADAIKVASVGVGVVLDSNNQMIWERGEKSTKNIISRFEDMSCSASGGKTVESSIMLMLSYQGVDVGLDQLSIKNSSAYAVLEKYSKYTPIRLTGVTLDNVLYFVSKGRPLIAMTDINDAVIIYGYDSYNIMVINPATGKKAKMGIQDSANLFEAAGNVFLSYLEQ